MGAAIRIDNADPRRASKKKGGRSAENFSERIRRFILRIMKIMLSIESHSLLFISVENKEKQIKQKTDGC